MSLFNTFVSLMNQSLAQAAAPAGEAAQSAPAWMQFVPIVFMVVVFYFLVMRPQAKKAKEHAAVIASFKRGDLIITDFGMLGKIDGITEKVMTIEIADGVKIKILKHRIAGSQSALEGK